MSIGGEALSRLPRCALSRFELRGAQRQRQGLPCARTTLRRFLACRRMDLRSSEPSLRFSWWAASEQPSSNSKKKLDSFDHTTESVFYDDEKFKNRSRFAAALRAVSSLNLKHSRRWIHPTSSALGFRIEAVLGVSLRKNSL